jgi:hypothetical protein
VMHRLKAHHYGGALNREMIRLCPRHWRMTFSNG